MIRYKRIWIRCLEHHKTHKVEEGNGNQYADDPQMQQKIREKVMESLKYLVSLVNDVLDMNKLQSGDLKDSVEYYGQCHKIQSGG